MTISKSLAAIAILAPLALTGCGGKADGDKTTLYTKDKIAVTVGEGSADITSLPFYFQGSTTLTALDSKSNTAATGDATVQSALTTFSGTTVTLTGVVQNINGIDTYVLTISSKTGAAAAITYTIGVVKDINGAIYTFNAADGLDASHQFPVLQSLQSNKFEVYSLKSVPTVASNATSYLDYSVNLPTTVGTDYAPLTGQPGATKLVPSATQASYRLVKDELKLDGTVGSSHIAFADFLPTTAADTDALNGASPVTGSVKRFVRFGSTFPGAYWKAGYGLLEVLGRINDDKVIYAGASATTYITTDGATVAFPAQNEAVQVTYTEYNVNLDRTKVSGYYSAAAVIPHAAN